MNLDNLNYSKQDGSKVINIETVSGNLVESDEIGGMGALDSDYSKGEPHLDTAIVFILSGGSEREKNYFRPLKIDKHIKNIKIAFRSKKGQGLKPYELVSKASDFIKNKTFITEDGISYHIENRDTIYLIQDVDEFGPDIKKYLETNDENLSINCNWIISNPSFEIWLFYHHYDNPSMLADGLDMSEHDRSNWLKEYLNKIIPGGVKSTQALHFANIAIGNSRKNYSEENGFPNIYATQMHLVAEKIIAILGENEYKAMNERRNARITFFKSQNHKNNHSQD
jgi:hypothetical protein